MVQRISLWKNEFLDQYDVNERARLGSEYDEVAADIYTGYAERLEALGPWTSTISPPRRRDASRG